MCFGGNTVPFEVDIYGLTNVADCDKLSRNVFQSPLIFAQFMG
jgi:hypothetical protein